MWASACVERGITSGGGGGGVGQKYINGVLHKTHSLPFESSPVSKKLSTLFPTSLGGRIEIFPDQGSFTRRNIYKGEKKRVWVGSYFFCYRREHAKQQQTHMAGFSGEGALLAPPCNSVLTQKGSEIQIIFHLVCSCLPASLSPRITLGLAATTS